MAIRCAFEKNYPEIHAQNEAARQRELARRQQDATPDQAAKVIEQARNHIANDVQLDS
jgi:hypothetical protein